MASDITVFSGSAHREFAQEVCDLLGVPLAVNVSARQCSDMAIVDTIRATLAERVAYRRSVGEGQTVWEYGKDKQYLQEKCKKAGLECFTGSERYTSSLCPKCGCRHRPTGRRWICPECGFSGHRDIVGAVNMHALTFGERVRFPERSRTTYLRPAQESRRVAKRHACVTMGGEQ